MAENRNNIEKKEELKGQNIDEGKGIDIKRIKISLDIKGIIMLAVIISLVNIATFYLMLSFMPQFKYTNASSWDLYLQTLPTAPLPEISQYDAVMGDLNNAKVVLFEYAEYQCPYCAVFYLRSFKQIEENYIKTGKIAFVYKLYPLYSIHPYANISGAYSVCVYKEYGVDSWAKFKSFLFEKQSEWVKKSSVDEVREYFDEYLQSRKMLVDISKIHKCLEDPEVYRYMDRSLKEASDNYGIGGTPSFVISVKTSNIDLQKIKNVRQILDRLKVYGLSYEIYSTPDNKYILIVFSGALPYEIFDQIFSQLL